MYRYYYALITGLITYPNSSASGRRGQVLNYYYPISLARVGNFWPLCWHYVPYAAPHLGRRRVNHNSDHRAEWELEGVVETRGNGGKCRRGQVKLEVEVVEHWIHLRTLKPVCK